MKITVEKGIPVPKSARQTYLELRKEWDSISPGQSLLIVPDTPQKNMVVFKQNLYQSVFKYYKGQYIGKVVQNGVRVWKIVPVNGE